jgi:hypothetical protein
MVCDGTFELGPGADTLFRVSSPLLPWSCINAFAEGDTINSIGATLFRCRCLEPITQISKRVSSRCNLICAYATPRPPRSFLVLWYELHLTFPCFVLYLEKVIWLMRP